MLHYSYKQKEFQGTHFFHGGLTALRDVYKKQ